MRSISSERVEPMVQYPCDDRVANPLTMFQLVLSNTLWIMSVWRPFPQNP
ncbi:hypothetical protein BH23PLA1_BH23PLA1_26430 [soil metagenome]